LLRPIALVDDSKPTRRTPDKLRAAMDSAEYKHRLLGMIFVKHISDGLNARRGELEKRLGKFDQGRALGARPFGKRKTAKSACRVWILTNSEKRPPLLGSQISVLNDVPEFYSSGFTAMCRCRFPHP